MGATGHKQQRVILHYERGGQHTDRNALIDQVGAGVLDVNFNNSRRRVAMGHNGRAFTPGSDT
ncbi:hypothetical protein [Chloroflexus sp.]|uniref:hypothetical protein n=1 Tax=Chloroflexus sp. TaxID=1904827 RepID=UPI002ACDBDD8|nr:hypothetical protein [Chloroflexus sp.]